MLKKLVSVLLSALIIVSRIIGIPANAAVPEESVTIRLATQPSVFQATIAQEKGFFKEEGLDVELNFFSYGPPIIESLAAKDTDVGFVGDLPALSGIANGQDIIIIGSFGASEVMHGIIARTDRGIGKLEDLKGKTIAVPFGSNTQPLVYLYLEKAGLTENDAEIINLGAADIPTAIIRGDIDAGVVWEPNISVALQNSKVKLLATAEGVKYFIDPVIARSEFTKAHPEATAKLLRALDKAGRWSHDNQNEAAVLQNKITEVDVDALKLTLAKKDLSGGIDEKWLVAWEKGASDAYKYGLIEKQLDARKYVVTDYLKAAGLE